MLTRMLNDDLRKGIKPAVIMNEIGDVNLDGQLVGMGVPMSEMLSGCICCTIRGDLAMEIRRLIDEANPDHILIEASGVANPIEILDAVTEAAFFNPIEIQAMITVVDAAHFLDRSRIGKGRTYRLMKDQIRCSSILVLNKSDLVYTEDLEEIQKNMMGLNPFAPIIPTAHCDMDEVVWLQSLSSKVELDAIDRLRTEHQERFDYNDSIDHLHTQEHEHHEHNHGISGHHHSYDHVMAYSHYFPEPLEDNELERVLNDLPDGVYRAKGIFTSKKNGKRVMFQFAYRQLELITIQPESKIQDAAVFIGEHFSKESLLKKLEEIARPA